MGEDFDIIEIDSDGHAPKRQSLVPKSKSAAFLRSGCGCVLFAIAALIFLVVFLGAGVGIAVKNTVDGVFGATSIVVDAGKGFFKSVVEKCREDPSRTIYVDFTLSDQSGADKLICAQIEKEVKKREEFKKFLFSSIANVEATAVFEYYVSLRKMRVGFEALPEGKIRATVYFDSLTLNTPVGREKETYLVVGSVYPPLSKAASNFVGTEFPKILEKVGNGREMMSLAEETARKSLEETLRASIFPLIGLTGENIEVVVIFKAADFERPADYTREISAK